MRSLPFAIGLMTLAASTASAPARPGLTEEGLTLSWADNMLTVRGRDLPGGAVKVWYLEAYCRPGSTDRDWKETVIPHATELIETQADGRRLRLRSTLEDGVVVEHEIRAGRDEVDFRLTATNPTERPRSPTGPNLACASTHLPGSSRCGIPKRTCRSASCSSTAN